MKNILNIDNGIPTLLSNVDDGTNTLYINDELVPSSEWTGTGYYTFTSGGLTFTIQKIGDDSGNIMLQLIEQSGGTSYRLIKAISADDKYYSIDDPAETDLADNDYLPFYDTSAGRKKKTLWSNITDKLKMLFYKKFVSSWTYNARIVSSNGSGQLIWVFTGFGLIEAQTSGNTIYIAGNAVKNYANWTYSRDGLTLTLNCTDHTPMLIIASDNNIDVTFTDVSTQQANNLTEYTYISIPRVAQSANALPDAASVRFREYTAGANYNLPTNDWYQILEIRSQDTNYGTQLALGMTVDRAYYRRYGGGSWGSWQSIRNEDVAKLVSAGDNVQSTSTNTFALGALNTRWFSVADRVPGQPSQHGFMVTLAIGDNSAENHQIWAQQSNGDLFHRGTNSSSYQSPPAFKKILDSSNYSGYALPLTGGELTGQVIFANNVLNRVGDDCWMGDQNVRGAVCFKGNNGATKLRLIQYNGTNVADITWDGSKVQISTLDPYVAVSVSGRTITLTKQSGGTSAITTQDTTYSITEYDGTPSNLANFVQNTAKGTITCHFRFRDANNVLGLGADWIKGWIQYQNAYGGQYSVGGVGLASTQSAHLYKITITGTNPFTVASREL